MLVLAAGELARRIRVGAAFSGEVRVRELAQYGVGFREGRMVMRLGGLMGRRVGITAAVGDPKVGLWVGLWGTGIGSWSGIWAGMSTE